MNQTETSIVALLELINLVAIRADIEAFQDAPRSSMLVNIVDSTSLPPLLLQAWNVNNDPLVGTTRMMCVGHYGIPHGGHHAIFTLTQEGMLLYSIVTSSSSTEYYDLHWFNPDTKKQEQAPIETQTYINTILQEMLPQWNLYLHMPLEALPFESIYWEEEEQDLDKNAAIARKEMALTARAQVQHDYPHTQQIFHQLQSQGRTIWFTAHPERMDLAESMSQAYAHAYIQERLSLDRHPRT